jgi:hypothetical protein
MGVSGDRQSPWKTVCNVVDTTTIPFSDIFPLDGAERERVIYALALLRRAHLFLSLLAYDWAR